MRSPHTLMPPARPLARRTLPVLAAIAACIVVTASACTGAQPQVAQAATASTGDSSPAAKTADPVEEETIVYAPSTTSSVPIILAARGLTPGAGSGETVRLTIFSNHSQANTLFLRGEIDILVTGLSVGIGFFRNGAPVQVINCNVSGLTYLVTYGRRVANLAELRGESLYVPFEGSPIEETSRYFAERENLTWKQDIHPIYAASDSALTLLKQGKAAAVALPEPFVSLAEQQPELKISFSYRERWDALTGSREGYPQVCAFVMKSWADDHPQTIARFNDELASAIPEVQRDTAAAATQTESDLGFGRGLSREVLLSALQRTDFTLREGEEMAQEIRDYYEAVGKPLDGSYASFFYTD